MVEEITRILLMGENGFYNFAKRNQDRTNLEPDKLKVNSNGLIPHARDLVPYGFSFIFGKDLTRDVNFGIFKYSDIHYEIERQQERLSSKEDYGRVNLERTIEGLENLVKENGADYVLIGNLISRNNFNNYWEVSGKAQLLLIRD